MQVNAWPELLYHRFRPDIRRGAFLFLAVALAYLLASLAWPLLYSRKIKAMKAFDYRLPDLKSPGDEDIQPYAFYQEAVQGRRVFGTLAPVESGEAGVPGPAIPTPDILGSLNLLGVVSGESPQAIIEDTTAQRTYYINRGQSIGDLKIEDIREGKVIIKRNGERFELRM